MKEYDAYLFDWDGTIARTLEAWLAVVRTEFEAFGLVRIPDDKLVESLGRLQPTALELGISEQKIGSFMAAVEKRSHVEVPLAELYDNAAGVLESLKNRRKKLALISTSWRRTLESLLAKNHLTDIFDIIITGEDVQKHKPDPEGIHTALDFLKVDKNRAVMIGDSAHDMGAAQSAGIDAVLFYPVSHQLFYELQFLKSHEPTYVVDDLSKLLDWEAA